MKLMGYVRLLTAFALLPSLFCATPALADGSLAPVFVRYGLIAEESEPPSADTQHHAVQNMYDNYGLIGGWLAEYWMRDVNASLDQTTQRFLDELPGLGPTLEEGITGGWGCFGSTDDQHACRPLAILHAGGMTGDDIALASNPDRPVDAISMRIHIGFEVLQTTIDFLTWSEKHEKASRREQLRIWYYRVPDEMPPDGLDPDMPPEGRRRPIFAPDPTKLSDEQQAMLPEHWAFWIESDPSPVKQLVEDFVRDFPDVMDYLYSTNAFDGEAPQLGKWYKSLEKIKPLVKKHGESCRFDYCKNRLIRLGENGAHHMIVRKYGPDYVIRVVPCSELWCLAD